MEDWKVDLKGIMLVGVTVEDEDDRVQWKQIKYGPNRDEKLLVHQCWNDE